MALDPDKVDENLEILLTAIETYNAEQSYDEYRIRLGAGDPAWSSRVKDDELYPLEYRRFVERIGWLEYSPGYLGLHVFIEPLRLGDLQEDNEKGSNLEVELCLGRQNPPSSVAEWAEIEGISDHLLLAEDPCSYAYVALDKSTSPYSLIELIEEKQCDSFLGFVVTQLYHPLHNRPLPLRTL